MSGLDTIMGEMLATRAWDAHDLHIELGRLRVVPSVEGREPVVLGIDRLINGADGKAAAKEVWIILAGCRTSLYIGSNQGAVDRAFIRAERMADEVASMKGKEE